MNNTYKDKPIIYLYDSKRWIVTNQIKKQLINRYNRHLAEHIYQQFEIKYFNKHQTQYWSCLKEKDLETYIERKQKVFNRWIETIDDRVNSTHKKR